MKNIFKTCLVITIGSLICALALNLFFIPHNLLAGGINGVAIIIYYLTGAPFGMTNLLINIPIFFLAIKYLGKRFAIVSIYGTIILSFAVDILAPLNQITYIHDPILSAVFGGVLFGIGCGIIYRYDGSTGGFDIIAAILKRLYSIEMGSGNFMFNAFLMMISAYIFNLELAVLTLTNMYIASVTTNKIVTGLNQRKTAYIISYQAEEIADAIIREVGRGATLLHGQGAFTKQEKQVIFVVINLTQIAKIKRIIEQVDPDAFLFITPTADVMGRGFTLPKNHSNHPPSPHYIVDEHGKICPKHMDK